MMRWRSLTLAAALLVSLCGCGGDSPATPSSAQRQLLTQGSGEVAPVSSGMLLFPLQLGSSAALEATVDWTNASTLIALAWGQGDCTRNVHCDLFAQNSGTAKPKTLTTAALAAGTYTLAILNFGTATEPVSYQIFLVR